MRQHFVTFFSPGTFVAEQTTKPIESWDVEAAKAMLTGIHERYGATPYGFQFSTRARGPKDLDSKVVERSPLYYVNCKVETLAEIEARNDPKEAILLANMRANGWDRIVCTTQGWRWTQPLGPGDIVLSALAKADGGEGVSMRARPDRSGRRRNSARCRVAGSFNPRPLRSERATL